MGALGKGRQVALDQPAHRRHDRDHHLEIAAALDQPGQRLAERPHELGHLGGATARQNEEQGQGGVEAEALGQRRRIEGGDPGMALDQRMADEAARRAAEAVMGVGLERPQRQHVVDVVAHLGRAARTPGPDAGRHVVDDRDGQPAAPDAPGDRVGELRAVDDDDGIGLGRQGRLGRGGDASQDERQAGEDSPRSHHRHVLQGELRDEPLGRHGRPADAQIADATPAVGVEGGHQLGAQGVPGVLAGDNEQAQVAPLRGNRALAHGGAASLRSMSSINHRWHLQ